MKLKPCPFCGSDAKDEAYEEEGLSSNFHPARVICKSPHCRAAIEIVSLKPFETNMKQAIERWNKRTVHETLK